MKSIEAQLHRQGRFPSATWERGKKTRETKRIFEAQYSLVPPFYETLTVN